MNSGTPRFIGARLLEAREVEGLTQSDLGQRLGVSAQAISQYEKGLSTPQPHVMERLPAILRVPPSFFVTPRPKAVDATLFFRSMSRATTTMRIRAKHKYRRFTDLVDYVSEHVELPAVKMPECPFSGDPLQITDQEVEAAATHLRRLWGLGDGAISHITHLLENQGVIIACMPLDTKALDSFSCWRKEQQRPYIVLGIEKEAAARSRFSLAHELGHMILHRNVEQELMRNTQAFKQMEEQAFRFAGAFLLPRKTFTKSFRKPSIASLTSLKYEWNVSIAAMLMRARDLDLLSKEEETRLWRNYSRRGYRNRELLDDEVPRERPAVLEQSIQLLVNEQVQSRDQICANVPLVPSEIEALAGLPSGFLSHQSQIKLRRSNEPSR